MTDTRKKIFIIFTSFLFIISLFILAQFSDAMAKDSGVGRYAVIEQVTGRVANVIILDPSASWSPPVGHFVILSDDAGPGDTWNGKEFEKKPSRESKESMPPSTSIQKSDENIIDFFQQISELSIEAGDVVAISERRPGVRKSNKVYDEKMIGVISMSSGVLLDNDQNGKQLRIAFFGQALVKVNLENGPVEVGDYLTSSNVPGVAMKATGRGKVVGMALESFDESGITNQELRYGKIMMFVDVSWYDGSFATSTSSILSGGIFEGLKNIVSTVMDAITGFPKMIVNAILEVKNDIITHGVFKTIIKVAKTVVEGGMITFNETASLAENSQLEVVGEDDNSLSFVTYSIISPRKEIMVSGSGELRTISALSSEVEAKIAFHPYFSAIISTTTPIRVIVTPTSYTNGNLYVSEKSIYGFTIKEINSKDAGVKFDWIVTAMLTDPEEAQAILDNIENIASQEEIIIETDPVEEFIIEPEPEPEPSTTTEPIVEPEPEPEPSTTTEPIIEPEPSTTTEPIIEPEPII